MAQPKKSTNAWYEKTWIVVILCIFFFPVGLYALWKNSSISIGWKIGVTAVIVLFVIGVIRTDPDKKNTVAETSTPTDTKAAVVPKYEVVDVKHLNEDVYCKVTMDDMYSKDELIEKTRQLRKEYNAKEKFSCYYYYKKYAEKTPPLAGVLYVTDCNICEYKDKDGDPVQFPFYYMQKGMADSLRALTFDTAGFKKEVAYLDISFGPAKRMLLSSQTSKALLVQQFVTGNNIYPLVKKTVNGEERFYDPEEEDGKFYYVINRSEGIVGYYKNGTLDWQEIIED